MSFVRYADCPILGVAGDRKSFRRLASADTFSYDPKDGFLYITARGISSRVNDNHDGFCPVELEAHHESFVGCPHFIEHDNANWRKARGVVVAELFHPDDASEDLMRVQTDSFESKGRYNPIIWTPEDHLGLYAKVNDELAVNFGKDNWIELLIEVDAQRFPVYGQALLENKISTFSMGCDVEKSYCSVCGNQAAMPSEYCTHIASKKGQWVQASTGGLNVYVYEDNRDISFFEISAVRSPADSSATLIDLNSCLQSAACNVQMLGQTLKILGEHLLDETKIPKPLAYELMAEAHKSTLDQERISQLLEEVAERL